MSGGETAQDRTPTVRVTGRGAPGPASDADPTRVQASPERLGPYRLHTLLGSGGFGAVYVASRPGGPEVAVKVLTFEAPGSRERFEREADLLRRLGGEGFPDYVEADLDAPRPWFAMELLAGITLDEAVRHAGPLSIPVVAGLGLDMARSLRRLHTLGYVHRDVKPANAVLAGRRATLIDVGIAKGEVGHDLTSTGELLGSMAWTAPERLVGDEASAASDVYGLGLLLAYASSGRPPFPRSDDPRTVGLVSEGRIDLDGVPRPLVDLVTAMTAREPADRPDMDAVSAALQRVSGGERPPVDPARRAAATRVAPPAAAPPASVGAPVPLPRRTVQPPPAPVPPAATVARPAPTAPSPGPDDSAVARLLSSSTLMGTLRSAHERGYDGAAVAIVVRAQRRSPRRAVKALDPAAVVATVWRGRGWFHGQYAPRRRFTDDDAGWTRERDLMRQGWWLDKLAGFLAVLAALVAVAGWGAADGTTVRAPFGWLDTLLPSTSIGFGAPVPWDLVGLLAAIVLVLVGAAKLSGTASRARASGWPRMIRIAPTLVALAFLVIVVLTTFTLFGVEG